MAVRRSTALTGPCHRSVLALGRTALAVPMGLVLASCGARTSTSVALQLWADGAPVVDVGDTASVRCVLLTLLSRTPTTPTDVRPAASASVSTAALGSSVTMRYVSRNVTIATVDSTTGVVTGRAPGIATIACSDDAGRSAALAVTVTPVLARLAITSDTPMPLAAGQSATLTFRAFNVGGAPVDGVPFIAEISNTSGATWAYGRQESSPHTTPLTLTLTVTGKLGAVVYEKRFYAHASRAFVDSIRVSSATSP